MTLNYSIDWKVQVKLFDNLDDIFESLTYSMSAESVNLKGNQKSQ